MVIDVRDLCIVIDGDTGPYPVVDGVSFAVTAGRTLCLVGESGCGKSFTALSIVGLLPAPPARVTGGQALFEGKDLLRLDPQALREIRGRAIAMIFQEPMTALNPAFTIGNQLAEAVLCHHRVSRAEADARALEKLHQVRIAAPESRLRAYPHQLSGGMRQRVMIAMALINEPRLLIADEPTTALDVTIQAQILTLMQILREQTGAAVILITHDLGVVGEVADDVVVMYAGTVVEAAPATALFADPQHPYTLSLLAALPGREDGGGRLTAIPGNVPAADEFPPGCRFSTRCPLVEPRCESEPPPLAELTGGHHVACWRVPIEMSALP